MYAIIPQQIPQDKRAEVNEKILFAINSGKDLIPAESIYNCYTGVGGLHNLRQSDFASYHEYARAKKEFELGQFFTPHEICWEMVDVLSPTSSEMVLDMCCGMGNFFNHLPNRHNTYGFDIDGKAVAVARYLYPDAHIEKCDIQQYRPEQRFDIIIGNPPFNLKFDFRLSQEYYMDKAYDLLNPAGILMIVVPSSFMQSEFWEKRRITDINDKFSFIGQCGLAPHAFTSVGVDNFNTKVMVFLRHSRHIGMQPYNADEFVTREELKERVMQAREMKHRLRFDLMRETSRIDKEELEQFEYKLAKYMYELKAHASLNRHRVESPRKSEQAYRQGDGSCHEIPQPKAARKCHQRAGQGVGTQEADDCQSACRHPQVHHNTECRAPEGNRAGQDLIRFQTESLCATSAG